MSHLPALTDQNTALSIRLSGTLLATTKKILGGSGLLELTQNELLAWWDGLSDEWKFLILQQGLEAKLWGDDENQDEFWLFDEHYDYKAEFDWDNHELILPFLIDLKSKKQLNFALNSLQKNNPLKELCYLTSIALSLIEINEPDVFIGLDNLTELSFLQRHQTINVNFLRKAHYLKKLNLDYGKIDNIDGLSYLINLSSLSLNHNHIKDISPLKFLDKLGFLSMTHNNIDDLTIISQLNTLESLDLGFNAISTIEPLSQLTNLQSLYLNHNQITDIRPLASLSNLRLLSLENNPIPADDIIWLEHQLPDCLILQWWCNVKKHQWLF